METTLDQETYNALEDEMIPCLDDLVEDMGDAVYPVLRKIIVDSDSGRYEAKTERNCIDLINDCQYLFLHHLKDVKEILGDLYEYMIDDKVSWYHVHYNDAWIYSFISRNSCALESVGAQIKKFCKVFEKRAKDATSAPDATEPIYSLEMLGNVRALENTKITHEYNEIKHDVTEQFRRTLS